MARPVVRVRGVRVAIPKGYVLGRASTGIGAVELLDTRRLRQIGVASAASTADAPLKQGFGFSAEGLLLNNEFLGSAVWPQDVIFTADNPASVLNALMPATSDASFQFLSSSLDLLGTYTVPAGETTGVLSWVTDPYTHPAGTPMLVYAPTPNDASLGSISASVLGVPA